MLITLPRLVLTGEMPYRGELTVDLARCRTLEFSQREVTVISRHSEIVTVKSADGYRKARAYAKRHFIHVDEIWINPAYMQQMRFMEAPTVLMGFAGNTIWVRSDLAATAEAIRRAGLTEVSSGRFASLAQTLWYNPATEEGIQSGMSYSVSQARRDAFLDLIAADDWIVHANGVLGNPAQIQMLHDDLCYYNSQHPGKITGQWDRLAGISWFDLGEGIKINLDHVDIIEESANPESDDDEVVLWLDNSVSMALKREVATSVVRAAEALQVR